MFHGRCQECPDKSKIYLIFHRIARRAQRLCRVSGIPRRCEEGTSTETAGGASGGASRGASRGTEFRRNSEIPRRAARRWLRVAPEFRRNSEISTEMARRWRGGGDGGPREILMISLRYHERQTRAEGRRTAAAHTRGRHTLAEGVSEGASEGISPVGAAEVLGIGARVGRVSAPP